GPAPGRPACCGSPAARFPAEESGAVVAAGDILQRRGNGLRVFRNMLVFLAPDRQRLDELRQAMRQLRAWASVAEEHEALNLDAHQRRTAEARKAEAERTVAARVLE